MKNLSDKKPNLCSECGKPIEGRWHSATLCWPCSATRSKDRDRKRLKDMREKQPRKIKEKDVNLRII